jgi:L-fuculose-phosphate aldolase
MRPEIGAVVHAHPCTATAFASAGIALDEPLCSEVVITLGAVPLAPYATTGTQELSDSLTPFISDHNAILMANHGVVTYGVDLRQAYLRMEAVEHYAKIVLAARQLGCSRTLDEEQLEKLVAVRSNYGKNTR